MFSAVLLSSLLQVIGGSSIPWYPMMIPVSPRHTSHVVPQPVIRTKFFLLKLEDSLPTPPYHQQRSSYLLPPRANQVRGRSTFYKDDDNTKIQYSTPIEESPWKPIFPPNHPYLPHYLDDDDDDEHHGSGHEDDEPAHHAGGHDEDEDEPRNLILPVGIKGLHNPQMRRPVKHSMYKVAYDENEGSLRKFRSKSERDYPRYKTNFKCAWCHRGK